jgi:hypothetical protein
MATTHDHVTCEGPLQATFSSVLTPIQRAAAKARLFGELTKQQARRLIEQLATSWEVAVSFVEEATSAP